MARESKRSEDHEMTSSALRNFNQGKAYDFAKQLNRDGFRVELNTSQLLDEKLKSLQEMLG
jgi:hypothetical protein